jgi:hypothetical protein
MPKKRLSAMEMARKMQGPIDPARLFIPHEFGTRVRTPIPTIHITQQAIADMFTLTDECDTEIGWLGTVTQMEDADLLIEEIFLPKQECHFATTKLSVDGLMDVYNELMARKDGAKLVDKLRFWGHSHVNMDVEPSKQDNDQMEMFQKNKCDFFVRGIVNKKAKMKFDVFYYNTNVVVLDCPWTLHFTVSDNKRLQWRQSIKNKVSETTFSRKEFRRMFATPSEWEAYGAGGGSGPYSPYEEGMF